MRLSLALCVAYLAVLVAPSGAGAAAAEGFPAGFLWGTATAGFQVEAGGSPPFADRASDWWAFTHDAALIREGAVSGDRVERGAGSWRRYREDLDLASSGLRNNAIRLGIEWSRIFPRSTAGVRTGTSVSTAELRRLDRLANRTAVRHYRKVLRGARSRGLRPMLTLNHFTLPLWIHDTLAVRAAFAGRGPDEPVPAGLRRAGWLDAGTVAEFRKYAAYAAWRFGDLVDLWATLNEPIVQASQGYVSIPGITGSKAPGVLNYGAAVTVVRNLGLGNAAAYDAIRARDRRARVGVVTNLLDWRPQDPSSAADARGARHADQVFNRLFLDAAIRGVYDNDADGVVDPGERRRRLRDKADWVGVNYYSPARATGMAAPITPRIPLFDFTPQTTFRGTGNPGGPPCPTTCSDFGWEIDPDGLRRVLRLADSYGKPLYVTENGIDDRDDDQRPGFLLGHLRAVRQAIADGADVRGYFHWSLLDNFEWAEGFDARFGLYSFDADTLARRARPSARLYRRIADANSLPAR